MTSTDTAIEWTPGVIPWRPGVTGRIAFLDGYKLSAIIAGTAIVVQRTNPDQMPTYCVGTVHTERDALDLVTADRAAHPRPCTLIEAQEQLVTVKTAELAAAVTPAEIAQARHHLDAARAAIRHEKETAAAGMWWCVTTDRGEHLVVAWHDRWNGGFGPVNVWDGYSETGIRTRERAHPSGLCTHL